MKRKILWVEDDYYPYQTLLNQLEGEGIETEYALSAVGGYKALRNSKWKKYSLIMIDMILPVSNESGSTPDVVVAWKKEKHLGVGLVRWLMDECKPKCPVVILSVMLDPINDFNLQNLQLTSISKRSLSPDDLYNQLKPLINGPRD